MTDQLEKDIAEWTALKTWLATGKARELELRNSIAARIFADMKQPNGYFPEGARTSTYSGYVMNYKSKLDAKLHREILEEMMVPTLNEAQLTADESKGLIRGKPELGLKAYRALPEAKQKIIDKMIVVKPGQITLEVDPLPK